MKRKRNGKKLHHEVRTIATSELDSIVEQTVRAASAIRSDLLMYSPTFEMKVWIRNDGKLVTYATVKRGGEFGGATLAESRCEGATPTETARALLGVVLDQCRALHASLDSVVKTT